MQLPLYGQQTNSTPENKDMPQGNSMAKLRRLWSRSWQAWAAVWFQRSNGQHLLWLCTWSNIQFSGTSRASLWNCPSASAHKTFVIIVCLLFQGVYSSKINGNSKQTIDQLCTPMRNTHTHTHNVQDELSGNSKKSIYQGCLFDDAVGEIFTPDDTKLNQGSIRPLQASLGLPITFQTNKRRVAV